MSDCPQSMPEPSCNKKADNDIPTVTTASSLSSATVPQPSSILPSSTNPPSTFPIHQPHPWASLQQLQLQQQQCMMMMLYSQQMNINSINPPSLPNITHHSPPNATMPTATLPFINVDQSIDQSPPLSITKSPLLG